MKVLNVFNNDVYRKIQWSENEDKAGNRLRLKIFEHVKKTVAQLRGGRGEV